MTRLRMFLAPLLLLLVGASGAAVASQGAVPGLPGRWGNWHAPVLHQVRIEQHFSIRITPGPAVMPPWAIEAMEEQDRVEPVEERSIGKCLAIASVATLRPGDGDELLLFLHDDRIISATLEKHCSARDFYSGFYIERNADGAICTGRDILHSRSGQNCKVRRLHELVPTGYRRFP